MKEEMKNLHILCCFIVSAVLLFAGFYNLHSAELSEDFIPTTGEIKNVESHQRHLKGRIRTEYDYTVTWEMNGQTYEKHFEDQIDYRPEGGVDIWVSPDNTQVRFSSAEQARKEAPLTIAIGAIAGIIGFVLLHVKKKEEKRKYISKAERIDRLENRKIYSLITFMAFAVLAGFFGYDAYKEYNPLSVDVIIACVAGMVVCVGIFLHAHIKMKQ